MDLSRMASQGAETIHRAFDEHHQCLRAITRRVRRRFEERDWDGIRRDTVEKLDLPSRSIDGTVEILRGQLGERLADREVALTDITFREMPPPRDEQEEMAAEPWFTVGENDVFPSELLTFLGLQGRAREAFLREHGDLFGVDFWHRLQERLCRGEVVSFFPYGKDRRLRP